jgi:hypothetical protein
VIMLPEGGHPMRRLACGRWNHIPSHQADAGLRQSSRRRPDLTLPSPPPPMSGSPSSGLRPGSGRPCRRLGHEGASTLGAFPLGKHWWQPVRSCATPPVGAELGTPEGKWLDELASLIGKACPRLGAQGSLTVTRGPSRGDSRPLS